MAERIFFDVTFTRTQLGNVGITRTVRRLFEHLRGDLGDSVLPVAFHSRGFRIVSADDILLPQQVMGDSDASRGLAARVLRWALGSRLRRRLTDHVPLPLLKVVRRIYNRITFDALTTGVPIARFAPGDLLVMCDASWNYPAWLGARAARDAGARVVVMVHDLIPLRNPEFGTPLLGAVFREWLGEMLACSSAVVTNSAATMEDVKDYARASAWLLPPVDHFRLGSDVSPRASDGPVRAELLSMAAAKTPYFAAVGSIESRKNYGVLLCAFEQLWSDGHDLGLVILGRPTAECKELAEAMVAHPESRRRFLPIFDASDNELQHVYSTCRALVFPSLAEGFGLPLVEARTRGALVIASDIPAFRELADAGVLLFEGRSEHELRKKVLESAQSDRRTTVVAMPLFTWRDSARQLLAVAHRMTEARHA